MPGLARKGGFAALWVISVGYGCGEGERVFVHPDAGAADSAAGATNNPSTPDSMPDGAAPSGTGTAPVAVGGNARVRAGELNVRTGAGTQNSILTVMPCGSEVHVIGGPS